MPNKNYLRGRRFEWVLKKSLEAQGYIVFRTAGSHGMFDLIAVQEHNPVLFIQCKVTKDKKQGQRLGEDFIDNPPLGNSEFVQAMAVKTHGERSHDMYYASRRIDE